MIRSVTCAAVAVLALAAGAAEVRGQPIRTAAESFAEAWGSADLAGLRIRMQNPARLTIGTATRTGLRPEQAVAAIRDLLRGHADSLPTIRRAETMDSSEGAGFAELLWQTRDRASGTPVRRTILITFTRVDATLLVSDLRILP